MRHFSALRFAVLVLAALAFAGVASAGEKKLMHCFAFTPIETATEGDWQAFYKATDALPGKIPGLTKVWSGKLRRPLNAGGPQRTHGVCMEMASEETLKTYASHPEHKTWVSAYEKVRQPGTTTFDIIGQ